MKGGLTMASLVAGVGKYQYEVIHDWGEVPSEIKYGNTHGVVEDSQGYIYVFHTVYATSPRKDAMVVFDPDGKFVRSWGQDFAGGAHGLHINHEDNQQFLYLCDIKRSLVVKTTLSGEEVLRLGYPNESPQYHLDNKGKPSTKYVPTNVAVATNGDIYVADGYGSSFINQYNSKGEFIRTFGGYGSQSGQLACPHGLIVDKRGDQVVLMVADRGNNRIQNFTLKGEPLNYVEGTHLPCHFDEYQGLIVAPDLGARVTLLDQNNHVINHLGEDPSGTWRELRLENREKFPLGKFVCPHGACFDHEGNIFVVEWVEIGRITKLRKLS